MAMHSFPVRGRTFLPLAAWFVAVGVLLCSIYANLSFAVTNPANYRFFPPFIAHINGNMNRHLGAEYCNIAQSLVTGQGFANPFGDATGPTAWMPPLLSWMLAGLLWAFDGNRDAVMTVVIAFQGLVLIGTGFLVVALARQTMDRVGAVLAVAVYIILLVSDFKLYFQLTHDSWLVLLALDLLVAGLAWAAPLATGRRAVGWGILGGLLALISPIVGLAWALLSLLLGYRQRIWRRAGLALLAAALTVTPWTVRNLLVFGRLVPVKSNAAYELYQSQCLEPQGLIQRTTFQRFPGRPNTQEGQAYRSLGEAAYVDLKAQQFWQAVAADPLDFLDRVAHRFLATTLWYVPFDPVNEARARPVVLVLSRLLFPIPFLALLILLFSAAREPLHPIQWIVIGAYGLYLFPYILASYYERYSAPLLGIKVLLVLWTVDRLWTISSKRVTRAVQPV